MNSLNYYRCFEITLSSALQMLCSVCVKGKLKSNFNKMSKFYFFKIMLQKIKLIHPTYHPTFLRLLDFDVLKKDPAWIE